MDWRQNAKGGERKPSLVLVDEEGKPLMFSADAEARYSLKIDAVISVNAGDKVAKGDIIARIPRETGKTKEAIFTYKQALQLKPSSNLFKISYAEAILADNPTRAQLKEIIPLLEHSNRDNSYPIAYNLLGKSYSLLGEQSIADYYSAEYNNAIGNHQIALKQLNKALKQALRSDILLRAKDLQTKLKQDTKKTSLF